MSFLPKVPTELTQGPQGRYLVELVRQMDSELRRRPFVQSDGALYIGQGTFLRIVSPAGEVWEITVNNGGNLQTTQRFPV